MANFLEVYNSVKLIENKDRKIICTGINIKKNKKVIIKLYKESDYNENDFIKLKSDVKLCRENKDNNIINIYSIGTAMYNNSKYYTVELEYIEDRSLKKLRELRTFEEIEALEIISQIINELKVLEIENIKFKNLNTESILLDELFLSFNKLVLLSFLLDSLLSSVLNAETSNLLSSSLFLSSILFSTLDTLLESTVVAATFVLLVLL